MLSRARHTPQAADFRAHILADAFPCIGAKAAQHRDQVFCWQFGDMRDSGNDMAIAHAVQRFARHSGGDPLFTSCVILFSGPDNLDEPAFEKLLWERLQGLHNIDVRNFSWDTAVSAAPDSPHFSMSIGGKAFYVVGLHPNASRLARRYKTPALVFNLHSQFEKLRRDGKYDGIRATTLERDRRASGSINPMLARFGEKSEAAQYSGRMVDEDWKCPFHARVKHDS